MKRTVIVTVVTTFVISVAVAVSLILSNPAVVIPDPNPHLRPATPSHDPFNWILLF